MKDHEVAELTNRITKIAQEHGDSQSLRERIAQELRPLSKKEGSLRGDKIKTNQPKSRSSFSEPKESHVRNFYL